MSQLVDRTSLLSPELARRLDRLKLVTRQRLHGSQQGDRPSRRRGHSLEFADYRPYSPGDDPARIDWNVYGRSGQLEVKLFEAEELLSVRIVLDASASMRWGEPDKFERARQIAAALGYLGLVGGTRLHVEALHRTGPARSRTYWGRRQVIELLRFLAALDPDAAATAPTESAPLASTVARAIRARGSSARAGQPQLNLFISDLLSEDWPAALTMLCQHRAELIVVHLLDPAEIDPPVGGDFYLVDQEHGERVAVTLNAEVVAWYRRRAENWLGEVATFCARRGIRYARHLTSQPIEHWLFHDLRARRILQ